MGFDAFRTADDGDGFAVIEPTSSDAQLQWLLQQPERSRMQGYLRCYSLPLLPRCINLEIISLLAGIFGTMFRHAVNALNMMLPQPGLQLFYKLVEIAVVGGNGVGENWARVKFPATPLLVFS